MKFSNWSWYVSIIFSPPFSWSSCLPWADIKFVSLNEMNILSQTALQFWGWNFLMVWLGLGRMFYSGQAKLFTTILRNCQTTKCQEFWSNITEYSWRNQDWNVLESRRKMRGAGAVGDKFYRVQESKYPIEGFVRWKDRRVVKMRDSIGNISISSNWKYLRRIFQSKPKPLEEQ